MQKEYQEGYAKAFHTLPGQQGGAGRRDRARTCRPCSPPTTRRRTSRCGWTPLYGQNVGNALNTGVVTCSPARATRQAIVQGVVDAAAKE